ncbi:hypothetical protein BV378_23395 [Nostoc sp. RF31YmG]|nr:hypothetical protein BV378_23395 [Nostoc sp. RF31YmG]
MGIVGELKQISSLTLEILRQNPPIVELFRSAKYQPESPFWKQATYWNGESAEKTKERSQERFERFCRVHSYKQESLKNQFLAEWEIPALELDKSWSELTFFLAGYIPGYVSSEWTLPELKTSKTPIHKNWWKKLFSRQKPNEEKDFLSFLVIKTSQWDGLPLVNAIGTGAEIGYATGYGPMRYLLPNEVEQVMNGLIKLSKNGFQERFYRESEKEEPCPWIDWSDKEELMEWMTDLYNETVSYYQDAAMHQRAMLLYLT